MKSLKIILKFLLLLLVGMIAGLLIGGCIAVLFTDASFKDYIEKFASIGFIEVAGAFFVGVAGLVVSVGVLVPLHEVGHLVCGLLSGYRFVSFRIFNLTFLREDGHIRVKRFAVAGTGGQCLLCPPDRPLADIPSAWYNMGGVLANILALLAVLPLLWADVDPFVSEFVFMFVIVDLFLIITNGIPMTINGFGNDAYNMRLLRRSELSKRGMVVQLRSNAMIQAGVRPRDMPAEWFVADGDVDYHNPLEACIPIMAASRLTDMERWEDAYVAFSDLYGRRDVIMPLYVKEIACELAYAAMITGRIGEARALLDDDLMKYVHTYSKVMSSKLRLLCAVELYINDDRVAAVAIYEHLHADSGRYLLQGEVRSDLDLMKSMLFK